MCIRDRVFVLLNVIKRDQEFSDEENRMLASRPKLTWESIKSGDFMTDFETYVSDQFFARNQWISLKLNEDRILGKKESNGVYLGKKGYLIEKPDTPDWESVERNMAAISDFAERHSEISTYACFVPNAYYILEDRLPAQAPVRDQAADLAKIREMEGGSVKDIDVTATLQDHAEEDIYYKTDHHWTSLGAVSYTHLDVYKRQLLGSLNAILPVDIPYRELPLPIGISFYTFQTLSYVIDVYRGNVRVQRSLLDFALYVTMFPQLIAGPIVKYADIARQLRSRSMGLSLIHIYRPGRTGDPECGGRDPGYRTSRLVCV